MASDKEHLRGLLRDDNAEVPPHLAWDKMRDGILASMAAQSAPAPEPEPERPAKRRIAVWWWLPLLLLGAGLPIAIYAYLGSPSQPPAAAVPPTVAVVPAPPPAPVEEACPPVALQAPGAASSPSVAAPRTGREGTASSQSGTKPASPIAVASAAASVPSTPAPAAPMPAAWPPADQAAAAPVSLESGLAPAPVEVTPAAEDMAAALEAAMPLPTLATSELELPTAAPATPAPTHQRPARRWHLGLTVGTVQEIGRPALQGDAAQGIAVSETALYGPSALVYAEATLHRHAYARLGVAQQQLQSRLDYNSVQRTQVPTSNLVVQRQVNAITGDTTLVQGDTLIGATRTRIVQHYNQSTLLNIPLSIGYRYPIGRWELGLEATASFNIRARHTGLQYRAADDSLIPVTGPEGSLLKPQVGTALGLGVSVAYRLSPRISLAYQGSLSQHLQNWAQAPGADRQPRLVSHGLGLRWRL